MSATDYLMMAIGTAIVGWQLSRMCNTLEALALIHLARQDPKWRSLMTDDTITPDRLRLAGLDDLCRSPETCPCCTAGRSGLFRRPGADFLVRLGANGVDYYWLDGRLDGTKLAGMADVAARVLAIKEPK